VNHESRFEIFGRGFLAASVSEAATIPLDTAKVKMQLDPMKAKYTHPVRTIQLVVKEQGPTALFAGLPAGIMRAGTIYATRLGVYENALHAVSQYLARDQSKLDVKIMTAMPVTVLSMMLANPWDVLKVRYQRVPNQPEFSVSPRMIRGIIRSEGFWAGLYAGFAPNLVRNMVVGSAELVGYFHSKQMLMQHAGLAEGFPLHLASSLMAAASAALLGSPMDVVATRVMQPDVVRSGVSSFAYTMNMLKQEGPLSFYKGFLPNWLRLASFNVVLWITFEQFKKWRVMHATSSAISYRPNREDS